EEPSQVQLRPAPAGAFLVLGEGLHVPDLGLLHLVQVEIDRGLIITTPKVLRGRFRDELLALDGPANVTVGLEHRRPSPWESRWPGNQSPRTAGRAGRLPAARKAEGTRLPCAR